MALQPDTQLLPDGDILIPIKEERGYHMFRVSPEDQEYADWLAIIQAKHKARRFFEGVGRFVVSAAVLYFGAAILFMVLALLVTTLAT